MSAFERSAQGDEDRCLHAAGVARMKCLGLPILLLIAAVSVQARSVDTPALSDNRWFEDVKKSATPEQLYTFLYAMPKGADLHNHLSGSARSEWMWDAAIAQEKHGYTYYTKVTIRNCVPYGSNEYGPEPYFLLFRNITAANYAKLDGCQRSEFKRLQDLDAREKQGWLDSLRLDKASEGRNEFFNAHWQRMNDLYVNPYWSAEILYRNMEAFGTEGSLDEAANIIRARLAAADAKATGVEVRFQNSVLRFAPNAEDQLRTYY